MNQYYNIISNILLQNIEQISKRSSQKIDIDYLIKRFNLDIDKDDKKFISKLKSVSYSMDRYSNEKIEEKQYANKQENINNKSKKKKFKHNHQSKSKKTKNQKTYDKPDNSIETPLESIFNIFRYDAEHSNKKFYRADKDKELLDMPIKNTTKDYDNLVLEIKKDLEKSLENEDLNALMTILEGNLSTVPCKLNGEDIYDISLYDNVKLTAALAGCKYFYLKEDGHEDDKEYMLVSADISGIQNFIYTISSKGALKSLRGRSFYLEIISENIIDQILNKIGLCRANLLYSGGGHFYMLLPNTKQVRKIIEDAKKNINQWFIDTYRTGLYIEISYMTISEENLSKNDMKENIIGNLYKKVGDKNSQGKLQRYTIEQLEKLMLNSENVQDEAECTICHNSFKLDKDNICDNCRSISELGNNLPKIQAGEKLILIKEGNADDALRLPSIDSNKELSLVIKQKDKLSNESYIRGYSINSKGIQSKNIISIQAGVYSKQIENQSGLITFEQLASMSKGIKRVGVLRADVDNLGKAFSEGFELKNEKDKYKYISFSRNSNLSYNLSKFFKSDINNICKGDFKGDKFKFLESEDSDRSVAIVYAGGDDLFIVGAWNEIIELAVDINNQFKRFTNNKMTLSAGIGIFNAKYPIDQMAFQTGELEQIAKSNGKDRICLFEHIAENINEKENDELKYKHLYTWEEFEKNICNEKIRKLYKWFDFDKNDETKLKVGMSLLYRMLTLVRKLKSEERINLARVAYLIGRLETSKYNKDMYLEFKEQFYKWMLNENDLKQLETALTLIIYLNRKDDQNE